MRGRPDDGLRALFRAHVPGPAHWQTMETGVSRGVPDSEFCMDEISGWIEMKSVRKGWSVPLRPEQVGWLMRRSRAGGRCFVAIRRRVTRDRTDELWLYRGDAARWLKRHGLRACPAGHEDSALLPPGSLLGGWTGGPDAWPWREVRRLLLQ